MSKKIWYDADTIFYKAVELAEGQESGMSVSIYWDFKKNKGKIWDDAQHQNTFYELKIEKNLFYIPSWNIYDHGYDDEDNEGEIKEGCLYSNDVYDWCDKEEAIEGVINQIMENGQYSHNIYTEFLEFINKEKEGE